MVLASLLKKRATEMPGINKSSEDDMKNQKVGNGTDSGTPSPKKAKSSGKKVMARITMLDQKLEEFPIEVSQVFVLLVINR